MSGDKTGVTVGIGAGYDYVCNGINDTAQIQAAINYIAGRGGGKIFIETGTYNITSTLNVTSPKTIIEGAGWQTVLSANFAAGDVIYFNGAHGSAIRDIKIVASIFKTSGAAIHINNLLHLDISWVAASDQPSANFNLYNSVFIENSSSIPIKKSCLMAHHSGIEMKDCADVYFMGQGFISTNCYEGSSGIHIGGNCGGIIMETSDISRCRNGLTVDTALTGTYNREIFLYSCWWDSCSRYAVFINDNSVNSVNCVGGWFCSAGRPYGQDPNPPVGWANGCGLYLASQGANTGEILISGCNFYNNYGTGAIIGGGRVTMTGCSIFANGISGQGGFGVVVSNENVITYVLSGSTISYNNQYGLWMGPGTNNYNVTGNLFKSNGSGSILDNGGANKIVTNNVTA